jgi:hypothetical protein|tara:strand:+ start:914 stop:1306 length:393 start_codon:yes stop_codon:yes gene_type:complete
MFESKLDKMSSSELQAYAMKYGKENNMSDAAVAKMFGSKIKQKQAEESKGKKKMSKGGDMKKKKVPVISISVGMAELKKDPSKKAKMMRGGTANKKEHMYSAGGSVTDKMNPGLRALNKTRPDVVKKILS